MEELEQLTAAKKSEAAQAGPVTAEDLLRIDPDLDPQFRKAVEILREKIDDEAEAVNVAAYACFQLSREAGRPGGAPAFVTAFWLAADGTKRPRKRAALWCPDSSYIMVISSERQDPMLIPSFSPLRCPACRGWKPTSSYDEVEVTCPQSRLASP